MIRRMVVPWLVLVVALGASTAGRERLERLGETAAGDDALLYLPNGKHLRALSLGHPNLLADAVYLWAIQFYSDYERKDRYRYVEHVFGNVIAELDPHYTDAYWIGSMILIVEARDLEGGVRLLERGFEHNPDQWILPYLAGWECHRAGQFERAAAFFEAAAGVPGAAEHVARMRAGAVARAGDVEHALALWRDVMNDPAGSPTSRKIAQRQVRRLAVRLDVERLQDALAAYRARHGRWPAALGDLVRARLIAALPLDPRGRGYAYDPRTGEVGSDAGRLLAGQ